MAKNLNCPICNSYAIKKRKLTLQNTLLTAGSGLILGPLGVIGGATGAMLMNKAYHCSNCGSEFEFLSNDVMITKIGRHTIREFFDIPANEPGDNVLLSQIESIYVDQQAGRIDVTLK